MNHKRPPLPAIIVIVVLVLIGLYFVASQILGNNNGALTASGTIEATRVNVAPELAGKVADVLVEEGQTVSKDEALLHLDPSLLTAQYDVASAQVDAAKAALAAAQTVYDQTLQADLSAQESRRAADWRIFAPDDFNQPLWYIGQSGQILAAQSEVDAAKAALDEAFANLDKVIKDLDNAGYVNAEKRLSEARAAFLVAQDVKIQAEYAAQSGGLLDAAYDYYNDTLDELQSAQEDFNALTNDRAEDDIKYARGRVVVAQQRFDAAYSRLLSLQTGENSPSVVRAQKSLEQAGTALALAQANLALLDAQIAKLTISAPLDGVVLTRSVEAGEFVQPGATAFVLGQLNHLTITVFVPEDRYGEISLGQEAEVTVDSFPGRIFTASVIQIADNAEFTPRNIQTVEGRSSTVYAIKLRVGNPEDKLKIGMPADVLFK
jgi:multidrug efflux pump subunit AcrA (membrane-fusion protein)